MAPVVKLTYFNLHGKAEHIRLILHAGKVEFEDKRIESMEEWGIMKPTTVLGQVPVLNWDGLELVQSNAIARFVAKKVGLAGSTEEDFVHADMILEHCVDYIKENLKIRFEKDPAMKQKKRGDLSQQVCAQLVGGSRKDDQGKRGQVVCWKPADVW